MSCAGCGRTLAADTGSGVPCPDCGAIEQVVHIVVTDTVGFHDEVRVQVRQGDRTTGRPLVEVRSGGSWSRRLLRWMHLERRVDRVENRYTERVIDPTTGEVVHEADHALSDHRGHGSARGKV